MWRWGLPNSKVRKEPQPRCTFHEGIPYRGRNIFDRLNIRLCRSVAQRRRPAASRACALCDSTTPCTAARRLKRLVRQSSFAANRSRRIQDTAKRLVDRLGRCKCSSDFWFEENEVAPFTRSRSTYFPRTPPFIVAKSYSGLRSSLSR